MVEGLVLLQFGPRRETQVAVWTLQYLGGVPLPSIHSLFLFPEQTTDATSTIGAVTKVSWRLELLPQVEITNLERTLDPAGTIESPTAH